MREWINTVAIVFLAVVVALIALWFNAQLSAQRQMASQESAQFQVFLKEFTAESNYTCSTLNAMAHESHYALPFAPPGTCNVTFP